MLRAMRTWMLFAISKKNDINIQVRFPKEHSQFSCMIIGISSRNSNVSYNIIHFPDRFIFLSESMASNRIWQNRIKGISSYLYFCLIFNYWKGPGNLHNFEIIFTTNTHYTFLYRLCVDTASKASLFSAI